MSSKIIQLSVMLARMQNCQFIVNLPSFTTEGLDLPSERCPGGYIYLRQLHEAGSSCGYKPQSLERAVHQLRQYITGCFCRLCATVHLRGPKTCRHITEYQIISLYWKVTTPQLTQISNVLGTVKHRSLPWSWHTEGGWSVSWWFAW